MCLEVREGPCEEGIPLYGRRCRHARASAARIQEIALLALIAIALEADLALWIGARASQILTDDFIHAAGITAAGCIFLEVLMHITGGAHGAKCHCIEICEVCLHTVDTIGEVWCRCAVGMSTIDSYLFPNVAVREDLHTC